MTTDTIQKNGNINQMMWRTRGRERQAYNFSYDYLDRLRSAVYADVNDAGTVTTNNRYNESLTYADARGNISNLKRMGSQINGACWDFAQIDNLTYSYTAGTNKIVTITDAAATTYKARGFNPYGGVGVYAYDANGNMYSDPYKFMTITYNHLNLPKLMTFVGVKGGGTNTIEILYDAAGTKLRKTVKTGATVNYTQDYIGGIEYRDGVREAIYTAEGRLKYTSPTTTRYEYNINPDSYRDLGNTRISFSDLDNNGVVNETNNPTTNEVLQENHYYPFGLNMDGPWMNDAALDNKYQYNGKEFNDDFGLNLNDYGARWYDASVGRWWSVDPIGELTPGWSSYTYTFNNSIKYIDPTGMIGEEAVGADGLTNSQWIDASRPNGGEKTALDYKKESRENGVEEKRSSSKSKKSKKNSDPTPEELSQRFGKSFNDLFVKELLTKFNYEFEQPDMGIIQEVIDFVLGYDFFILEDSKGELKLKLLEVFISANMLGSPPPGSGGPSMPIDLDPKSRDTGLHIWNGAQPVGRLGTTLNPGVYNPRFEFPDWEGGYPTYTSPLWLKGSSNGNIGLDVWLEIERLP